MTYEVPAEAKSIADFFRSCSFLQERSALPVQHKVFSGDIAAQLMSKAWFALCQQRLLELTQRRSKLPLPVARKMSSVIFDDLGQPQIDALPRKIRSNEVAVGVATDLMYGCILNRALSESVSFWVDAEGIWRSGGLPCGLQSGSGRTTWLVWYPRS